MNFGKMRGNDPGCAVFALIIGGVFLTGMLRHYAIPIILIASGAFIIYRFIARNRAESKRKPRREESYQSREYREKTPPPVKSRFADVQDESVRKSLEEADAVLNRILRFANEIAKNEVKEKVLRIAQLVDSILMDIKKQPSDYRKAKQFLTYYLESTEKIIHKYTEISNNSVPTPQATQSMRKAEAMMDTIEEAFKKQLGILHSDEIMKLDVEMEVLEKTLKMEGF